MRNPSAATQARTLLFAGPRVIAFRDEPIGRPAPDEVRIQTIVSGISRGTEMTVYRGDSPYYEKNYDAVAKLFTASESPSWSYPLSFGYENVGRIVELGSNVADYRIGDIVFTPMPHVSCFNMSTTATGPFFGDVVPILKLPAGLQPEPGVFAALNGVAYNAVLDGKPLLGESIAVFGAGVVGLLTLQLLLLGGAEQVFVIDPVEQRRKLAEEFGATAAYDPTGSEDIAMSIRERTRGRGADLAIEASGSYAGLHEAIRCVGYNGRVVVSSYLTGAGESLRFGEEFHHNRVQLISSQSFGVHPDVSDRWSPGRRALAALAILPKLKLAPMITHRFAFDDAASAFALVDEHPEQVLQVILEYDTKE